MAIVDFLKACELFSGLDAKQLQKIAPWCRDEHYGKDSIIFNEGAPAQDLYIITEGNVALEMNIQPVPGRLAIPTAVEVLTKNEILGWSALVEPFSFTLSARCMTPTSLLAISSEMMRRMLAEDPEMGFRVMTQLSKIVASRLANTRLRLTNGLGIALLGREMDSAR